MANEFDKLIDSMCLTWRHDFDLITDPPLYLDEGQRLRSSGMTHDEREGLRRQMRQLVAHHGDRIASQVAGIDSSLYEMYGAQLLELTALLDDWNALCEAVGAPNNGGAVGYARQLRQELEACKAHASDTFTE